jgi:NADPH:quinone reductase-like Zn-dependent oxidoreductase
VDFELNRKDLHDTRFVTADPPMPADGQALLRVESFGLTSNNITYAVFGDAMNYWAFFPTSDPGWGALNVWGYAHVEESRAPGLATGMRVYGYLPCASHLLVVPDRINAKGFVDAAPHRASLPSAYQGYRDVATDPVYAADLEDEHILFFPLFFTSFLIDDFLADEGFFGADTIVVSSASSKTAIIAAYLLAQRGGIDVVGLTSEANRGFVESLGVYDAVVGYDDVARLPGERAVYVDVSGDGGIRTSVHAHYGDRLAHSSAVGMTHWAQMGSGSGELAGPKPVFFFAPDRIAKRGADWGTATLDRNVAEAWTPFARWASAWLRVDRISSEDQIRRAYLELLDGTVDPRAGTVVNL